MHHKPISLLHPVEDTLLRERGLTRLDLTDFSDPHRAPVPDFLDPLPSSEVADLDDEADLNNFVNQPDPYEPR